jgi:hypothetical protein
MKSCCEGTLKDEEPQNKNLLQVQPADTVYRYDRCLL